MLPEIHALVLLFLVGLAAGYADTLAGGGGLLTLPVLLLTGISPISALATNKFQSTFGSGTAALSMIARRAVTFNQLEGLFVAAFLGSMAGAFLVHYLNMKALDVVIPVVLTAIALYMLLGPKVGELATTPRISKFWYQNVVVPIIGFYDGMFGPGTGSFLAVSGVALRGYTILEATAIAKVLNFATNIAALIIFLLGGKVLWIMGFVMGIGQLIGAFSASRFMLNGGQKYIRPVMIVMCFGMLIRYVVQKHLLPHL